MPSPSRCWAKADEPSIYSLHSEESSRLLQVAVSQVVMASTPEGPMSDGKGTTLSLPQVDGSISLGNDVRTEPDGNGKTFSLPQQAIWATPDVGSKTPAFTLPRLRAWASKIKAHMNTPSVATVLHETSQRLLNDLSTSEWPSLC